MNGWQAGFRHGALALLLATAFPPASMDLGAERVLRFTGPIDAPGADRIIAFVK
ncbi:hypothetical protein [Massilia sp. MS-15]|uniref:hypothetical protein n=1 Tax=Massilia sp. MS-15 TaxID=2878200 RepID=UPI001CD62A02|nr:hypothetical protein [Massilia sp. MS-15]MCA1245990.1 hypothetical protein [Massilia sp. MS-15]